MASSFTNPMKKHDVTIWKVIKSINETSLESLAQANQWKRGKKPQPVVWTKQSKIYKIKPINHVLCVPQLLFKQLFYEQRIWIKKGLLYTSNFKALRLCNWSCHSIEEYTRYLEKRIPHWCFSFLIFTVLNIRKYI